MKSRARREKRHLQTHGCLFIHPPPVIKAAICRWRERQGIPDRDCPTPHITLTRPFLHLPTPAEWHQLRGILADVEPFVIRLTELKAFWPGNDTAWQQVEPGDKLAELHRRLQATGLFHEPPPGRLFTPHLSLYYLHVPDANALRRELAHYRTRLPSRQFLCRWINYVRDGGLPSARIRRSLRLGGSDFSPTAVGRKLSD